MRMSRKLAIYANKTVTTDYEWLATYSSETAVQYQFTAPYSAQYIFYVIGAGGSGGTAGRPFIVADSQQYQATGGAGGAGGSGGHAIHYAYLQQGDLAQIDIEGMTGNIILRVGADTIIAGPGGNGQDGSNASAQSGGAAGIGGSGGSAAGANVENNTGIIGLSGDAGSRGAQAESISGSSRAINRKYLSPPAAGGVGGLYPDNLSTDGSNALYTSSGPNTALGGSGGGGGSHASFVSTYYDIPAPPGPPTPPPNPNISLIIENDQGSTITMEVSIEDYQLNYGRIMLPERTVLPVPQADLAFVAWQETDSGNYYTTGEYLSLRNFTAPVTIRAIWGPRVYVGGDGFDEHSGLTPDTRVRTLGRAFEILARQYSGNPNANINGLGISGNAVSGFQLYDNPVNQVTFFHGQIVLCSSLNYHNSTEGRYQLITYEKIRHGGIGTVTYDDGTGRNLTFIGVSDELGYQTNDPVRVTYQSAGRYLLRDKDYSGTAYHMLERKLNQFSYQYGQQTYYGYGRLVQYSQSLRQHTSTAILTPRNDGIVMLTSRVEPGRNYQNPRNILRFYDYTRYALDGALIFEHINLGFRHDRSVESPQYVAGLAACGNYLAIGEEVLSHLTAAGDPEYYIAVNLYGGGFIYRYNGIRYFGVSGNRLGDAGQNSYINSRITVKSGNWSTCYAGNYGLPLGRDPAVYGFLEDNAGVLNIYGGIMISTGGSGHEGAASATVTYLYIYGSNSAFTVYGSGSGSNGRIIEGGRTNILIHREMSAPRLSTVYGGSGNGSHQGDTNIVVIDGRINEVFGGSRETDIEGNTNISMFGGSMDRLIGGGRTGSVTGKVTINVYDGIINDSVYSSSAGSTVALRRVFYNGPEEDGSLTAQITNPADERLKMLMRISANPSGYPEVPQSLIIPGSYGSLAAEGYQSRYYSENTYELSGDFYYYPHVFSEDYSSVIAGYTHTTYINHGELQYTITRYQSSLNLAFVGSAELNISGGTVYGDIFGGGEVALVLGDTMVRIVGGVIHGKIYGGGNGAVNPMVPLYTERGYFSGSSAVTQTRNFEWAGEETFNLASGMYSPGVNPPIDYENAKIYSPNYKYMGSVYGNTTVLIAADAVVNGEVTGDGKESTVFGTKTVVINRTVAGGAGAGGSGAPGGVVIEIGSYIS